MEQKKSGTALPISGGILLFTIIFGTLFVTQHPFHVKRNPGKHLHDSSDAIPARLWEDPFSALENSIDRKKHKKYPSKGHQLTDLASTIATAYQQNISVDILGIWVWGGPHTEASEWRIRSRYAALSALGVLGFRPDDADHLHYILFNRTFHDKTEEIPIPYEWFSSARLRRRILILWLDAELLPGAAIDRIHKLKQEIYSASDAKPGFTIIGPAHSNDYRDMVKWAIENKNHNRNSIITIYSPFVTIDEAAKSITSLLPDGIDANRALFRAGIELVRTIHSDGELASTMRAELERRGIDTTRDNIALVSEWDSVYASELMDTFERAFAGSENSSNIYRYCYMRGLDGITPDNSALKGSKERSGSSDETGEEIEKPVGQGQYDYLRRMGKLLSARGVKAVGVLGSDVYDKLLVLEAMHDLITDAVFFTTDLDARYFHPAYSPWSRNLVVVSSYGLRLEDGLQRSIPPFRSVYQTSLFLAVRQAVLDSGLPPGDFLTKKVGAPRIFEIGNGEAFDISIESTGHEPKNVHPPVYISAWLEKNTLLLSFLALSLLLLPILYIVIQQWIETRTEDKKKGYPSSQRTSERGYQLIKAKVTEKTRHCATELDDEIEKAIPWQFWAITTAVLWSFMILKSAHCPQSFKSTAWPGTATVYLFLSMVTLTVPPLFLMVCALMKPDTFRVGKINAEEVLKGNTIVSQFTPAIPRRFYFGAGISILVTICCLCSAIKLQHTGGEPFTLLGGISLWPTIFLLLIAGILALFLIYLASYTLHRNIAFIPIIFCQGCSNPKHFSDQNGINRHWTHYVELSKPALRLKRTAVMWCGYFGISFLMVNMDRPFVPFRGEAAFIFHCGAISLSVLPMLFLVLYVADVTKMCSKLTQKMLQAAHEPSAWCRMLSTASHYGFKSSPKALELWFNIRILATHTEAIAHMVYFPLLVIIIMLSARLTYFDRVDTPVGLAVVIAMTMAHAVIWPARMRRHAELLRQKAKDEFQEALLKAHHSGDDNDAAQLKEMINYVTTLEKGAFRPFSRQPWVHVIMTIFGGGSGYAVLRYLGI